MTWEEKFDKEFQGLPEHWKLSLKEFFKISNKKISQLQEDLKEAVKIISEHENCNKWAWEDNDFLQRPGIKEMGR